MGVGHPLAGRILPRLSRIRVRMRSEDRMDSASRCPAKVLTADGTAVSTVRSRENTLLGISSKVGSEFHGRPPADTRTVLAQRCRR